MGVRWTVPTGEWWGETCLIIGGGPSLKALGQAGVAEACRGVRVICVNDAYRLAPWGDVLYACDASWWHRHWSEVAQSFRGELVTIDDGVPYRSVKVLRRAKDVDMATRPDGLEFTSGDPGALATGGVVDLDDVVGGAAAGNGGFQALNLACLYGSRRIGLLGFDMRAGADGKHHWFGDHPQGLNNPSDILYDAWRAAFRRAAPELAANGVEVFNVTQGSALDAFPFTTLEGLKNGQNA